jgi:hypothetical protein
MTSKRYTIARVKPLNGESPGFGKYIIYNADENNSSDLSLSISGDNFSEIVKQYLLLAEKNLEIFLSTKPNEQYLSMYTGKKMARTYRLEELADSEKSELDEALSNADEYFRLVPK